jgi:prepilin-type N-terminal cleavage/methylation domain-containing protein
MRNQLQTKSVTNKAMSLIELLIVIGIIATLSALLLPSAYSVYAAALRTECKSNLRQIGYTVHLHLNDYGTMPAEGNKGEDDPRQSPAWFYRLPRYLDERSVNQPFTIFHCPAYRWSGPQVFTNASPKSYKMNSYLDNNGRPKFYRRRKRDGNLVLFLDCHAGETGTGQWGHATVSAVNSERHDGTCNMLLTDGTTLESISQPADNDWSETIPWKSPHWQ